VRATGAGSRWVGTGSCKTPQFQLTYLELWAPRCFSFDRSGVTVAKKKWVRASVLLLVAAVAAGILAGCGSSSSSTSSSTASSSAALDIALQAQLPASIRQSGVITVATDVPYVPFEQFLSDGKTVTGLDVDLMNAIEPILGVKFQINNTAYANIIPALEAKRYDIGWSAISVGSLGGRARRTSSCTSARRSPLWS